MLYSIISIELQGFNPLSIVPVLVAGACPLNSGERANRK